MTPPGGRAAGRVLGVDPGLAATGWCVVEPALPLPRLVACGTIRTAAGGDPGVRLAAIAGGLRAAIAEHGPAAAAIEEALVARSARSALRLGEARGAAMLAAAEAGLPVHEYLPMRVKQAVTGYGHADKGQVARMVGRLVAAERPPASSHAADAVAVALCHLGGGAPTKPDRGRRSARAAWTALVEGGAPR